MHRTLCVLPRFIHIFLELECFHFPNIRNQGYGARTGATETGIICPELVPELMGQFALAGAGAGTVKNGTLRARKRYKIKENCPM